MKRGIRDIDEDPNAVAWEVAMGGRDLAAYERLAYFLRVYRILRFRPKRILDVGSGFGVKTFYIARVFPDTEVTGIDPGREVIERALSIKKEKGIENVDFTQRDVQELETREHYDLAIMSDVLEHIKDDKLAFKNVYCSLKKGGVLYVHTPCISDNFDLAKINPREREKIMQTQKRIGHVRIGYRIGELKAFFREGFRYSRVERCGFRLSSMACKFMEYFCARDNLDSIEEFYQLPNFLFHDFKFLIDTEVRLAGLFNFVHEHGSLLKRYIPYKLKFTSIHGWGVKS